MSRPGFWIAANSIAVEMLLRSLRNSQRIIFLDTFTGHVSQSPERYGEELPVKCTVVYRESYSNAYNNLRLV